MLAPWGWMDGSGDIFPDPGPFRSPFAPPPLPCTHICRRRVVVVKRDDLAIRRRAPQLAGAYLVRAVEAQVEIESKVRKWFKTFELQALTPGAVNPGSTCTALPRSSS